MSWTNKQLTFTYNFKLKFLIAFALGLFLAFIIIFLEPFDTDQYESRYRLLNLAGFGFVFFGSYLIYGFAENARYNHLGKIWTMSQEIVSLILFFLFAGSLIFLYNHLIVNAYNYSLTAHLKYLGSNVIVMIPVLAPFLVFFRLKFGEFTKVLEPHEICVKGENKNENLILKKSDLYYIQAEENYIRIVFMDSENNVISKTFRQSLSNVHSQLPFLIRCHRSYLVNQSKIKDIKGNVQGAKIHFSESNDQIPLSKSFYKDLKSQISVA